MLESFIWALGPIVQFSSILVLPVKCVFAKTFVPEDIVTSASI